MNESKQFIENKKHEIISSYISKDEFLNIINNTEFLCIKEAELSLLTGFLYNADDDTYKELYKNISIS